MGFFSDIQQIDLIFTYADLGGAKTYKGATYKTGRYDRKYYAGEEHTRFLNKTQDASRRSLRDTVRRFGLANFHRIVSSYQSAAPASKQIAFGRKPGLQLVVLASKAVSLLPFVKKAQINIIERQADKPVVLFPARKARVSIFPLMLCMAKAQAGQAERAFAGGYMDNSLKLSANGQRVLSTKDANGLTLRQRLRTQYTERQTRALMASLRADLQERARANIAAITVPAVVTTARPQLRVVEPAPMPVAA